MKINQISRFLQSFLVSCNGGGLMKILILEDDQKINDLLTLYLNKKVIKSQVPIKLNMRLKHLKKMFISLLLAI